MCPDAPEMVGVTVIRDFVRTLGEHSGVYRMLDAEQNVLYVGKARVLKNRVQSYTRINQLSRRIALMVSLTRSMESIATHTEAEALLLEAELIKRLKPRFNILLRDDKSYPELLIRDDHDFPRLMKHRGKHKAQGQYFGPYAHARAVNLALDELQKSFLLRTCTDSVFAHRSRPCLLYDMKRCAAPCVDKVSAQEYGVLLNQARGFLQGKSVRIQAELAEQMQAASEQMQYEKAGELRDRLAALTAMQQRHNLPAPHESSADVMAVAFGARRSCVYVLMFRQGRHCGAQAYFVSHGEDITEQYHAETQDDIGGVLASFIGQFYQSRNVPDLLLLDRWPHESTLLSEAMRRYSGHNIQMHVPLRGDKRKLIDKAATEAKIALAKRLDQNNQYQQQWQSLLTLLKMNDAQRIEAYDNSHLNGSNPVGVMIVADSEGLAKKDYRKFNIRGNYPAGDDYAFMREVLQRRLKKLSDPSQPRPDLLLIDGGKGQLGVAEKALEESGLSSKIALASIVKGPGRDAARDRLLFAGQDIALSTHPEAGLFVQRLRDEAHRFAIGAQRTRRKKGIVGNSLDDVEQIGAKRKKSLLLHFGSAKAVANAGIEDIAAVEGISSALAEQIYQHYRHS